MNCTRFVITCVICLLWLPVAAQPRNHAVKPSFGQGFLKAGTARVIITPQLPMWLSGYASRKSPGNGVVHDLWAKALAIQDNKGGRVVIVTTDLLGLSHEISEEVFRQVHASRGIERSQLLLNSSHTHSGPSIWPNLDVIYDFTAEDQRSVSAYGQALTTKLVTAIETALDSMKIALLYSGHGTAGFAVNRRNDIHPGGPVDHDVPVLSVTSADGKLMAVLFGYACHNTTMVDDNFLFNGDYAGFAQMEIEKKNPGAVALFLMGCGGDQNPAPRGTLGLARQHGDSLAQAVQQVLSGKMKAVRAPVSTGYEITKLNYRPFDLELYRKDIVGTNPFFQRRAKLMLEAYNKGWDVSHLPYPVQIVRFGRDLTLVGLGGEVVVDYSLRAKKEFAGENLYIAGYCNEVTCYIPSKRLLQEGGYEPDESMIYYGMPGPFTDSVEETIFSTVRKLMSKSH